MKIKQTFFSLIMPIVKIYWKIIKPEAFGVKVLLTHPHETGKVLLVRHTYGNIKLWNIPGGGYNPKKENAETAAAREVFEELGVKVLNLKEIGIYQTSGEGKKDNVTIFSGTIEDIGNIKQNPEISELSWDDSLTIPSRGEDVARVARRAVEKILS